MNRKIKRSKSLRAWNKYKNLVYLMAAVLVVIILVIVGISKAVGGKEDETTTPEVITEELTTPEAPTEPPTTEPPTTEPPTTEPPTTEPPTLATDIVKIPEKQEFTSEEFYSDAVFVGDVFVSGMDVYQYLDSSKLVYGEQWTIGKASNAIDKIAATNANKVYIQLGLNDLCNGRSGEKAYELYQELVTDIKAKLPNATIYVVSTFPVSQAFEEGREISNEDVETLNGLLSTMEGVTYLNVAASISNSDGSLNTDLSANGYNIVNSYYGFILNLIAEMCQ